MLATPRGSAAPRKILILNSYGRGISPSSVVAEEFETELAEQFDEPLEFHETSLELPRLPERNEEEAVVNYLKALFDDSKPDLVVPFGAAAAQFMLRQRTALFPSTPLLLSGLEMRHLHGVTIDTNTTVVGAVFDFPSVAENVLQLWPSTTNLVIVLGSSQLESFWKTQLEHELQPFTKQLRLTWLNQLSLAEIEQRVRHLPPRSAILYAALFVDAAGVPYEHDWPLKAIHVAANAPIVSMFEEDLGKGTVGGALLSLGEQSMETADVAVSILNGETPGDIRVPPIKPGSPVYDWRELKRWNVSEAQLPPGSRVLFRTPSFVQQYRGRILAIAMICLLESALIIALFYQLRRRRRIERSLRENEERVQLAAGAAELGMWEWDLASDQLSATGPTAARIQSGDGGRLDSASFFKKVHPDDRVEVSHAIGKAMNGEGDYESIHRVLEMDGSIRWIAARGRVEFNGKHRPSLMRGVSMDVTTRKEAERLARENEKWFRLMADSAPVLIWASGKDKLCTFVNKPWLELTGRTLEQERGNGWAEGIHAEDQAKCLKVYYESFDARRPFTMEYRVRRHDGQYRWLVDNGVPWYDEQNNFLGYIGSCVDVTTRKQAEAEAQVWRQELAHFSRVSTMGELAGSLAHELNQPLTSILFNTQAAQRFLNNTPLDLAELRDILGDIAREDRRAGQVIVRMRAMLKKGQAQMSPQNLNDIIAEVITMVHSELVVRHVKVATGLAAELPPVDCDRIQLQQVLMNLIVNACDAMGTNKPYERRVTIRTARLNASHLQVEVLDCGPGFVPEVMNRVFEPFFTTKPNGLGLGLQICRSIVQAHGGELSVGNNNHKGASVRFTLAVAPEEAQ